MSNNLSDEVARLRDRKAEEQTKRKAKMVAFEAEFDQYKEKHQQALFIIERELNALLENDPELKRTFRWNPFLIQHGNSVTVETFIYTAFCHLRIRWIEAETTTRFFGLSSSTIPARIALEESIGWTSSHDSNVAHPLPQNEEMLGAIRRTRHHFYGRVQALTDVERLGRLLVDDIIN